MPASRADPGSSGPSHRRSTGRSPLPPWPVGLCSGASVSTRSCLLRSWMSLFVTLNTKLHVLSNIPIARVPGLHIVAQHHPAPGPLPSLQVVSLPPSRDMRSKYGTEQGVPGMSRGKFRSARGLGRLVARRAWIPTRPPPWLRPWPPGRRRPPARALRRTARPRPCLPPAPPERA